MGCTTNQNLIYKSRVSVGSVIVLLVFCIYLFMPPMIMVLLSQSSLSAGMMVVATLLHISFAHYKILNYKILTAVLLILIYGTVSTFYSPDMKPLFSAIALIYIYTATVKFLKYLQEIHDLDAKKAISWLYYIMIIIGIMGVLFNIRFGNYAVKNYPVFPFAEPSHFALAYAPIAICYQLYYCSNKFHSFRTIGISLLLGVLYPNLILVIIGCLQFLILPKRYSVSLIFILIASVAMYIIKAGMQAIDYFYYRIFFDYSNLNLSNLVYLQGWEAAWIALKETRLFGLGFQLNGTQSAGFFTDLINSINKSELNRLDGGFLASKLISETGIIGIFFVLFLIFKAVKIIFINKKYQFSFYNKLYFSIMVSLLVELIFSGYGYFSPTFILALSFLSIPNTVCRNEITTHE